MAFDASGDALDDILYGGPLSYEPSDGLVLTMDERGGLSASEEDEGTYFVRVEDSRTAEGITPVRQWYYVIILFPHEPSGMEVKAAVLKEIDKLKPRGLDVHASLYTGDKTNKIVWKQIKALNDKFMAVNYDAATGRILPNWDWDSVHAAVEGPKYEIRTWTDATGKHKTQARFGGSAFGEVKLVNKAGKWIRLPLDKLSDEDQQWVRDRKRP